MIPLPAPYPEALKTSFGWAVRVESAGLILPVTGGEVTIDAAADVTRSLVLDVGGEDFGISPARDMFDVIWSEGGVLTCTAILMLPGLPPAEVLMGRFQVQKADWKKTRREGFALDALGVGSLLRDDRFEAPRILPAEQGLARIQRLVQETLGAGATVHLGHGLSPVSVPEATVDEDRLGACHDAAIALGGRFYERADGSFEVRATTGATADVGRVTLDQASGYNREHIYNGVRAESSSEEHGDVFAWAYDTDPSSPTRWGGPFGKKPRFYASPLLTTTAQAQSAAATMLASSLGRHFTVELSTVQNPTLEPGDEVLVEFDGEAVRFLVESVKIPLEVGGTMAVTAKEVR